MVQFDIKNQSFRQVMGNGLKYKVPRFQRDYSWQEEQWIDLWQDIKDIVPVENPFHYMGYLVLQSSDNENFTIIDGQQRLTTISILILAVLYELKTLIQDSAESEANEKRLETLRNNFIGFTDPVSLQMEHKLTLNRNNNRHFTSYLCGLIEPPVRNINWSERLMGKALQHFREQIMDYVNERVKSRYSDTAKVNIPDSKIFNVKGEEMARLIESTVKHLVFTTITVGNDVNAYTIFETLNARGVQLSTPDLVKNSIFSLIDSKRGLHDVQIRNLEDKWSNVIGQLGKNDFSHFIRVDWNSRHDFSRARELFKKIKTKLTTPSNANEYLECLQKNSEIYSALKNERDEFWIHNKSGQYNKKELKLRLETLNLFNIVAPLSALLAGFHKFSPQEFIKLLGYIEALSVRYNIICKKSPSSQERVYCEVARVISEKGSLDLVLEKLKTIYPSDEEFQTSFETKVFKTQKTNKKARYFLYRIERYLRGGESVSLDEITLEHILPQSPSEEWLRGFEDTDQLEEWINRLGNLTLLSRKENKDIGQKAFKEKKQLFEKSAFKITQQSSTYEKWDEGSISRHQKWLGKHALNLWRLP
ncbi:MAG: DUF262 domain-containing HNH endonuclease family protein [Bdellovibrionales bacterium]|nr:DUF262 domain-containing HNH endonuclease family protein [Bdellovibrionales bacterium]